MEAIRIQNLRSLGDTGHISIKPITLLLGANSSGKSTFARTFPLFRQSVKTPTTGPVLWFGELVDFGSFKDAHRLNASDECTSFTFTLLPGREAVNSASSVRPLFFSPFLDPVLSIFPIEFSLSVRGTPDNQATYAAEYKISFLNDCITLDFGPEGLCRRLDVNGEQFLDRLKNLRLLPFGQLFQQVGSSEDVASMSNRRLHRNWIVDSLEAILLRHCSVYFDGRTRQERRGAALRPLSIGTFEDMLNQMRNIPNQDSMWSRRVGTLDIKSTEFSRLRNTILLARLPRLLGYADGSLTATFSGSRYVAPIRATAERFYRSQNLAIDEVDSKGSNLTMFLRGLGPAAQKQFEEWTQAQLGFTVRAHTEGAHVSLQLKTAEVDHFLNLADLGFGFTQIIPVVTQIWHSSRDNNQKKIDIRQGIRRRQIITIEQPELHLHPRLQALVIDMIVRVARLSKKDSHPFVFVIETHSETMINRIGNLIVNGEMDSDDAQVLIFEKKNGNESSIRHSHYTRDGALTEWPYGFFLPLPISSDADRG